MQRTATTTPFLMAACCIAGGLLAQAPADGAGASVTLPRFDPERQTARIVDSLKRLEPLGASIRDANERIVPLVKAYNEKPTPEGLEAVESELSALTLSLSRDIGRVLGEKEKIRFAVQDVTRTSVLSEQAVAAAIDDMNKRAESEATAMQQGRERLEVLAAKAQDASPENRAAAMAEFKEAYRNYTRVSYRHKMLVGTATNHRSLLQGIGAVRRGFEAVGGNMQDVFDRIEDSGELLSFAAGIRKETADLLGQYRRILGDGAGSMREMMDTLRSIQGQMRILSTLSENLDTASSFTAIVKDMEDFSKTLVPEGATSLVPTGDDFWAQKVSEIASGRFFQQKPPVVGDK